MSDSAGSRRTEAVHAIWQDPTTYNAYRHGPPYLPGLPFVREGSTKTADEAQGIVPSLLGGLLAVLRALALIHQTYHWQTRGKSFYTDHLLFERLYNDTQKHIDPLAERVVFLESEGAVDASIQVDAVGEAVKLFYKGASHGSEAMIESAYQAERHFLTLLDTVRKSLQAAGSAPTSGQLPSGLDNLLQDIADTHEGFMYLLGQRNKVASKTASRPSYDYSRGSK